MQSILPEWYEHSDDTLALIYKTGTIALDANVMLDLYRVNKDQRAEIITVLGSVRDRLFIPYQAALEYQRSRMKVVYDNHAAHGKLSQAVELNESLVNDISDPELQREVRRLFKRLSKRFNREVEKLRDEHALSVNDVRRFDPVRSALDELLGDENFGERPSDETLTERRETAEDRIKSKTPPGFADAKKDDPTGDYLIWAELLAHKSEADRPLLFVTSDTKDDWFLRLHGQTLGPLPALAVEMAQQSDHPYHQTSLYQFLRYAKESLGADLQETTLETVERIAPQPVSIPVRPAALQAGYPQYLQQGPAGLLGAAYAAGGLKEYASGLPDTIKLASELTQRQPNVALQLPGLGTAFDSPIARQPPLPLSGILNQTGAGVNMDWLQTAQNDALQNIIMAGGQTAPDIVRRVLADTNEAIIRIINERDNTHRIATAAGVTPSVSPTKEPAAPAKTATPSKKATAKKATAAKKAAKKASG